LLVLLCLFLAPALSQQEACAEQPQRKDLVIENICESMVHNSCDENHGNSVWRAFILNRAETGAETADQIKYGLFWGEELGL
jgi:hypothetical protein